ncbi:MAG: DUF2993 domain-containing protein [Armatimonadota bacterium]|nr:DUF2993 domain-containing protein [Armatimonadota bacterium]MDR5697293.1 DUF2993 domain-containing protein [Armatimonadota bacterium]
MLRFLWLIVVIFVAVVVGAFALSGYVASGVEAQIRHQLAADPPDALDVVVRADPLLLLAGRVAQVTVRSRQSKVTISGLAAESFEAEMRNVALDLRALVGRQEVRVADVGSGRARVVVHEDDLQAYIRQQRNVDLELTLLDGRVRVRAPLFGNVVQAEGRLVAAGARVNLELDTLRVGGFRVESAAVAGLAAGVNPVLDLSALPLSVTVVEVRAENHRLVASAEIP